MVKEDLKHISRTLHVSLIENVLKILDDETN